LIDYFTSFQWYLTAVTGPKVTYLIIHITRKENFRQMQEAALRFLETTPTGSYMAIYFNTNSGFLVVNHTNVQRTQVFISRQTFSSPPALLNESFNTVFQQFEQLGGPCRHVVVLYSDSQLSPELANQVEALQRSQTQQVDIFTYTFGGLSVDPTVSQDLACTFSGEWFGVGSKAQPDINDVMLKYLSFYPVNMSSGRVTWTVKDEDVLSLHHTPTLTGCVPVFNRDENAKPGVLLGVSCIDVDMDVFSNLTGSEEVNRKGT
jgi:hypothetical protein